MKMSERDSDVERENIVVEVCHELPDLAAADYNYEMCILTRPLQNGFIVLKLLKMGHLRYLLVFLAHNALRLLT